jgi:N-acetylneuraminate synthase
LPRNYFPKTKKPLIIANIGGFSMDAPFSEEKKKKYYDRFAKSLEELDLEGVELIPQTMAPFPWHFGGQRYQNLYVLPDEMAAFSKKHGLRICLDVSHSKLTANHFKIDYNELLSILAPITAHYHIADAKGLDGEGLQVGEGEIDFKSMAKILDEKSPKASFLLRSHWYTSICLL